MYSLCAPFERLRQKRRDNREKRKEKRKTKRKEKRKKKEEKKTKKAKGLLSLPGGGQVDGLPPAASTDAGKLAARPNSDLSRKIGEFF